MHFVLKTQKIRYYLTALSRLFVQFLSNTVLWLYTELLTDVCVMAVKNMSGLKQLSRLQLRK